MAGYIPHYRTPQFWSNVKDLKDRDDVLIISIEDYLANGEYYEMIAREEKTVVVRRPAFPDVVKKYLLAEYGDFNISACGYTWCESCTEARKVQYRTCENEVNHTKCNLCSKDDAFCKDGVGMEEVRYYILWLHTLGIFTNSRMDCTVSPPRFTREAMGSTVSFIIYWTTAVTEHPYSRPYKDMVDEDDIDFKYTMLVAKFANDFMARPTQLKLIATLEPMLIATTNSITARLEAEAIIMKAMQDAADATTKALTMIDATNDAVMSLIDPKPERYRTDDDDEEEEEDDYEYDYEFINNYM